jgi:hypothetical protein
MRLLSARLLIPVTLVVVAWGGAHLLASPDVTISPAVWPVPYGPSPTAVPAVPRALSSPGASASPLAGDTPFLPGAMRQLNGDTRDTAVGLYALIQQLESALRGHIDQLVQQLEPGR